MSVRNLVRAAPLAVGSLFTLATACRGAPTVDIALSDPCHLRSDDTACGGEGASGPTTDERELCGASFCSNAAEWVQLAIFRGPCPSDQVLAVGNVRSAESVYSVLVGSDLPAPGDLPTDDFSFVALLRAKNCAVLGYGCTPASLTKVRSINIEIDPAWGQGACVAPDQCVEGQCAPPPSEWTLSTRRSVEALAHEDSRAHRCGGG